MASIQDPVRAHFAASLKELKGADFAKLPANGKGTVLERVITVFQGREKIFLESFTIRWGMLHDCQCLVNSLAPPCTL